MNPADQGAAAGRQFICMSSEVLEGGKGVRFPVLAFGDQAVGFVVRWNRQVHGYLNRCAHIPVELDWNAGDFFESSGLYLMCATHGALYAPDTGRCLGGPCKGGKLRTIAIQEVDDRLYWLPDESIQPPA